MSALAVIPGEEIVGAFRRHFGTQARPAVYRAPGRVNLIGEHTDYNLGFVFPIALEMACYVAIAPSSSGNLRIYSADLDEEFAIPVGRASQEAQPQGNWSDYVVGVAQELAKLGVAIHGADLCIASTVPLGSGLSSSAALEISSAVALLGSREMKPLDIALLGQRAESQFVGHALRHHGPICCPYSAGRMPRSRSIAAAWNTNMYRFRRTSASWP